MQRARCYLLGETAVVLELEPPITLASQKRIWRLTQRLVDMPNVVEAIPGMNNITVILREPQTLALDAIERLQRWWGNRIRALPGPEYREFDRASQEAFWRSPWQLSPQSNRMGYRLQGQSLTRTTDRELLSHGLLPGVVQVPYNGQPIVLMNDA